MTQKKWFSPIVIAIFVVFGAAIALSVFVSYFSSNPPSEKSAIHESQMRQKGIFEESKKASEASNEWRARATSANALAEKLGVSDGTNLFTIAAENEKFEEDTLVYRGEFSILFSKIQPDYRDIIKNTYPQCIESTDAADARVNIECIFVAFMLDRVSKNSTLMDTFAAAKREKVGVTLTMGRFYVDPGIVYVDVFASDALIIDFLMKDSSVVKKK